MTTPTASPHETQRRERDWHRGNDPAALWPGVRSDALQRAADAIGHATTALMRGAEATLTTDADARTVGIAALLTGMGPLLGFWLERGTLHTRGDIAAVLAEHLAQGRLRAARIGDEVSPLLAALAAAGAAPAVMKGFHTARIAFPDPGTRPFADVDVIVAPRHVATAEAILQGAGFTAKPARHGIYKRDWRPPGGEGTVSFELWHSRSDWSLELHDGVNFETLLRLGARLDLQDAFEPAPPAFGVPLLVPRPALLLAILATHASLELGTARLLRSVELVRVVRHLRDTRRLDWPAFEALLHRSRAARFVYPALSLAERLAPGTVGAGVLARARHATTRRARQLDARYTLTAPILPDTLSPGHRLLWTDGPREVLRELAAIASPPAGVGVAGALRDYHARAIRLASKLGSTLRSRHGAHDNPADREP